MFLSDKDVRVYMDEGQIKIDPFEPKFLGSMAYDLRLHKNFRLFKNTKDVTHIDVKHKFEVTELSDEGFGGSIVIHPGEFILGATHENIELGNKVAGLLEGRSSLARIGLIVHATAGFVNPGCKGHITFEMSNISNLPVKLYVGMRIAQLAFVPMSSPVDLGGKNGKSKYLGQKPPTSSRIWKDFED